MYILLGGTGHIGSALCSYLLEAGKKVTVITHDKDKVAEIEKTGAKAAVADVMDSNALHGIFKQGKKLFLLNPPAPPSTDTAVVERQSLASIFKALENSGLEKIVAESTYGAQPGENLGDLGVLYEMEQALAAQDIPYSFMRGAYYFSNWDMSLETAKNEGLVFSFYPEDFCLPMVAPADIARLAFELLTGNPTSKGPHYIAGPEDYTPQDVADAFAKSLNKKVEVKVIEESDWIPQLKAGGFSEKAAVSMANMTHATLKQGAERKDGAHRGTITLEAYIRELASRK
ncbi:NmrA family NAD(P)-binding protein [uncultured Flavobacterium sp.]|uniref:NmrA family NAD(P)-binding protein n=1 Tax=uncultured Flavobacterium sp. TaxID=165435 RepID=UPI0025F8117C|nr:NmrA family NAD(P)-binding protein [uncultured Flavobacterium sp.]